MELIDEIKKAKKEIVADGYEMSVGEIMNLYKDNELIINPAFQRLFRWSITQKTRFIESLLLGIPIPPIFVYQNDDGLWELIDGLQRLSTIFEFAGVLRDENNKLKPPLCLEGTQFLPGLNEIQWDPPNSIGKENQLEIKRARIRVEILKKESDPAAKYELFQRLNTGGSNLSEQEVRNCVAIMLNKDFYDWLKSCAQHVAFRKTIDQTARALERQSDMELALRFFAFRNLKYEGGVGVHEYLDKALYKMATNSNFSYKSEKSVFEDTFSMLNQYLGNKTFKRWDGNKFTGKFLMSTFEVIATGISKSMTHVKSLKEIDKKKFVIDKIKSLWGNPKFEKYSGAGISGTTRLDKLLPLAERYFEK